MVVAPRDDAGTRGGAKRSSVQVGVQKTICRELVEIRRVDRRSVTSQLAEASVIEDNEEDIGDPRSGAQGRRPRSLGFTNSTAHAARKGCAGFVFLEWHGSYPPSNPNPLDFADADIIVAPVIEARGFCVRVAGHLLRNLDAPAVREIVGNSRSAESVTADFSLDTGIGPATMHHVQHSSAGHTFLAQLPGLKNSVAE